MDAKLQRRVQRYGWNKAAGAYEAGWRDQLSPAQSRMLDLACLAEAETVLDVACGTGLVTLEAASLVGPSGSVWGTDISDRMVDLALAEKWTEARELHYRLLPLMEVNFIESSPGPVKAGLAMMNLIGENYRLPLVPIEEKSRARLREVMSELGLLKEASHATT